MYLGRLIFGRIVIFSTAYIDACAEYKENRDIHDHCKENNEFALRVPKTCQVAKTAITQWPLLSACSELQEQTHSCIDFSCGDFFMAILESWPMIVVSCFIVSVVFFTGLSRFYNFLQIRNYAKEREKSDRLKDIQANTVYIDLPTDHTTLNEGHVGYPPSYVTRRIAYNEK